MDDRLELRIYDKFERNYWDENTIRQNAEWLLFGEENKENIEIERSTGLKDKNGKLIYEGDIVREISKKKPEWEEYITTVEWKGCGFNLYRDDEFDFLVIGNIHENKELLDE